MTFSQLCNEVTRLHDIWYVDGRLEYTHLYLHPDTLADVYCDIGKSGGSGNLMIHEGTLFGYIVEANAYVLRGTIMLKRRPADIIHGGGRQMGKTVSAAAEPPYIMDRSVRRPSDNVFFVESSQHEEKFLPRTWMPTVPHPLIEQDTQDQLERPIRVVELD